MNLVKKRETADAPLIAQVTFSESAGFGAMGASESRNIQVFSPRGISYVPCEGDNLLLIPVDGAYVCAGVLGSNNMQAGEIMITSSGGAKIELKNSGEIIFNGRVKITKQGQLVQE